MLRTVQRVEVPPGINICICMYMYIVLCSCSQTCSKRCSCSFRQNYTIDLPITGLRKGNQKNSHAGRAQVNGMIHVKLTTFNRTCGGFAVSCHFDYGNNQLCGYHPLIFCCLLGVRFWVGSKQCKTTCFGPFWTINVLD